MTTPISLKDIIQAAKEAKTLIKIKKDYPPPQSLLGSAGGRGVGGVGGSIDVFQNVLDADLFISALEKLEKEKL